MHFVLQTHETVPTAFFAGHEEKFLIATITKRLATLGNATMLEVPDTIFRVLTNKKLRGDKYLDNYEVNNSVTSGSRSSYPTSYESYVCPLSSGLFADV